MGGWVVVVYALDGNAIAVVIDLTKFLDAWLAT